MKLRSVMPSLWLLMILLLPSFGQVQVNLSLINPSAQIFPVGDLNFINSPNAPTYFTVDLRNTASQEFTIYLLLRITLERDGVLEEIAQGQTNSFLLPANSQYLFTSQQFSTGTAVIPETGEQIEMSFDQGNINLDRIEGLEDDILATGAAPAGIYRFLLSAINSDGSDFPDQQEDHTLIITNPTTVEPLIPGRPVSESTLLDVGTIFPYFQWYSDVNPAYADYDVYIYEKYPEDITVQDVLSHPPVLQLEDATQNFFQYPASSGDAALLPGQVVGPIRPLEVGKTYYWQVKSLVETGTGQVALESDIFRFKVLDLTQSTNYASQILAFLRQILGPENEGVLQNLQEQGFEPNGEIRLQGRTVEINELLLLLSRILQGELTVESAKTFDVSN